MARFLIALFVCVPLFSFGAKSYTPFIWLTDGRDAKGIKSLDRLEVFGNGKVHWRSSSFAYPCPDFAGEMEGVISEKDNKQIAVLVSNIIREQKKIVTDLKVPSQRETMSSLSGIVDGKWQSTEIKKYTKDISSLERLLSRVKGKLRPHSRLEMTSNITSSGSVQVEFKLLGDDPFKLFFDEVASSIFSFDTSEVPVFQNSEAVKNIVVLNKENRVFFVQLKKPKIPIKNVYYRNTSVIHHKQNPEQKKIPSHEVFLCHGVKQ